jgi:hypothetical protein
MSSFGRVPLNDVWTMLKACAPGYRAVERAHHWCVYYKTHTYPSLPKGEHGARKNPEIQIGHIKRMCRLFGILDCAKRKIETLR